MPPNHSNGNSSLEIAQSSQDLIISKGKRKKRAWIIGTVIALIVIALIVTTVVLFAVNGEEEESPKASAISLEDILEGKLNAKSFNASWISDNELIYKDSNDALVLYDVKTRTTQELLPASSLTLQKSFEHELSADRQYLLLTSDYQKMYRHTYLAKYTIVNLSTKIETTLDVEIKGEYQDLLQYVTWAPVGNAVAFVFRNNVYYRSTASANSIALTSDGLEGHVYNGVPDWVYEEEVLSSNCALWFSSDGKKLAYIKFNDSQTSLMTIPYYGTPGSLQSQYTKAIQIRYPKPGTKNPDVSLHVVELNSIKTTNLQVPNGLSEPILASVAWATDEILCSIWMNRVQNEAYIVAYETSDNTQQTIKHLKQEIGWLELFTAPVFSSDGSELIIILSQDQGGGSGSYRHITKYAIRPNADAVALTSGKLIVTEILQWNDDVIYYTANTEDDPAVSHVYSIVTTTKQIKCISCNVTNSKNENCDYNSAEFSNSGEYYILNCVGPGIPEISVYNSNNEKLFIWENNEKVTEAVESKLTPIIQRFTFEIAGGYKAQVMLKVPPDVDLSGDTKYPMVVNVYGGPDSYQVLSKYSLDWGSYLAANKSIIYATIDGRGSGLKGDKMLFAGYRKLGTVEVEDQINVTRQIQQTVPYVDGSRTAIWGWSYGGYASGLALATDKDDVFKCGMSVAPVTDWTLYDSIYTERFMGLPSIEDNIEGYEHAKLLNKFEGLRNKQYFLIHGTFDDNVHYQQSMLWSKVLEHQDILFRQQSYPDEDHGLGSVRPHLYHSLENFLDDCFIENVT